MSFPSEEVEWIVPYEIEGKKIKEVEKGMWKKTLALPQNVGTSSFIYMHWQNSPSPIILAPNSIDFVKTVNVFLLILKKF